MSADADTDSGADDAPWLVVPFVLAVVLIVGLLVISGWSLA
jgi:hypothetical protein